ncbi:anti-sigma factor [Marinomonas algicola]|uniref:anti-sigma factor n=1 Tax=Marinomonas algicola TaxID=2773454 RepID=UPI0019D60441|nr:anti-sigma factor [Marinomonas algicola]
MNMNTNESIQMLAAEYVLGTLEKTEREQVEKRRKTDPGLEEAIVLWQTHFSGLNDYVKEVTPKESLFEDILAQLDRRLEEECAYDLMPHTQSVSSHIIDIEIMRAKLNRWRMAAFGASAIAACLAVFLIIKPVTLSPVSQESLPFVAVFQEDDKQPAFIMSLDIETRQLSVRSVTAQGQLGKTYQLWIKADEIGPAPRSLGLLSSVASPTQKQIDYDPAIIRHATFGISIEPEGGSPTGVPTGPAIHGKLYPTAF